MIYKCKMCGGSMNVKEKVPVAKCPYCQETQTFPMVDEELIFSMFSRANELRIAGDFDGAADVYEKIVEQGCKDSEVYWGLVLCKFGIEYVCDSSKRMVPTCHRVQYESITSDHDFKNSLALADLYRQQVYAEQAKDIALKQKRILELVRNEKPYDVFISFKQTDNTGLVTKDYTLANGIYQKLATEGYRVFFSPVSLLDHVGEDYEPFIFSALNSAKILILVGTSRDNMNAVWVRNEWGRFLKICKKDPTRYIIVCYRDMPSSDLPDELANIEALDMNNVGFFDPLLKRVRSTLPQQEQKQKATTYGTNGFLDPSKSIYPYLKRAFLFLEDGEWKEANAYCEKVLDIDPENAAAYFGKLMVELKLNKADDFLRLEEPIDDRTNYKKVMRFGDEELKAFVENANNKAHERQVKKLENDVTNIEKQIQDKQSRIEQYNNEISGLDDKLSAINDKAKDSQKKQEELENINNKTGKSDGLITVLIVVVMFILSFFVLPQAGGETRTGWVIFFGIIIFVVLSLVVGGVASIIEFVQKNNKKLRQEEIEKLRQSVNNCMHEKQRIESQKSVIMDKRSKKISDVKMLEKEKESYLRIINEWRSKTKSE